MDFSPRCPICRSLVVWDGNPFRPFCSERCQLVDLGSWANERYRVPGDEPAPPDDDGDDTNENGGT